MYYFRMKRLILNLVVLVMAAPAYSSLTKQDIEEIRRIVKEEIKSEIQHVNQRIDDLDSKLTTRITDLDSKLTTRIDDLNKRIDDMMNFMICGFSILFVGMFTLITFVIWDRRSALAPAVKRVKELEEEDEKIKRALREYAIQEPRLATVLRQYGIS